MVIIQEQVIEVEDAERLLELAPAGARLIMVGGYDERDGWNETRAMEIWSDGVREIREIPYKGTRERTGSWSDGGPLVSVFPRAFLAITPDQIIIAFGGYKTSKEYCEKGFHHVKSVKIQDYSLVDRYGDPRPSYR